MDFTNQDDINIDKEKKTGKEENKKESTDFFDEKIEDNEVIAKDENNENSKSKEEIESLEDLGNEVENKDDSISKTYIEEDKTKETEKVKENSLIDVYVDEESIKNDILEEDDFLLKAASFYSENYKYSKEDYNLGKKKLLIYSILSSLLGGFVVAIILSIYYSRSGFTLNLIGKDDYSHLNEQLLASKIEIEKTDTPVSWIAEKVSPCIVGIEVKFSSSSGLFFNSEDSSLTGSGIIIRSDGYIVTNYHVIENSNNSENVEILVTLPSNLDKSYEATVIGKDSKTDIAILQIDATGLYEAEFGDSKELEVGDLAVAIGNPGGLEYMGSVTVGVISGLNREIAVADNTTLKLIQTDAAINPGNSGGALVNSVGEIVGMNTAKLSGVDVEGLGFAIPIGEVQEISNNLIEYKYVKGRPLVGVVINEDYTKEYAEKNDYPTGLLVDDVVPLSGAYNAGIRVGDLIKKLDGKKVTTFNEFEEIKNKHKPGDELALEIFRDDETITVNVKTTEEKAN